MLLQPVTSIEYVVVVEDALDDEEVTLVAQTTFEDPIFLTTIEDSPSHSMVEPVLVEDAPVDEEATLAVHGPLSMVEGNTKPRLVEDPLIEIGSSSSTRDKKDEYFACPPLAPPSHSTMTVRRWRKSYNSLPLRRSACLAQCGVFKDLDIVGIDGKPDESSIQAYTDHLKDLLPPDLLKKLLSLKCCAFWDSVVEVYFPIH
ncbi:hypothetical protein ZEAMMB73_Zm00001d048724 [Zea mays]|jgi:hypothetical protein|uniref:Uncharacterized protein n=1 Tax=Zea mays TaxID=4577 RepID=A0A1D6PPC2_MAIZE|nr:hypothetical protein ZEAMMB73_Zm00001d048724 [Zea mays]